MTEEFRGYDSIRMLVEMCLSCVVETGFEGVGSRRVEM